MDRLLSLEVFVKSVELGGLAKAADALNISASGATQHIRALEEEYGARLLERTTRRIALTEAGALVHQRASQVLEVIEDARSAAASLQEEPRGRLRVSVPVSYAVRGFGDVIVRFMEAYPRIHLDVVADDRRVDLVADGFDVAIRVGVPEDSTLIATKLAPSPLIVCCAPSFLAQNGQPSMPSDLQHFDCLEYGLRAVPGQWLLSDGLKSVSIDVSGQLTATNGEMLRVAAVAGLGIILAPSFLVRQDLEAGRLVRILADWHGPDAWVFALRPAGRYLPAKVRAFVDFVRDMVRAEVA